MEAWLVEKLNETSMGGYFIILAVIGWAGKNIVAGIKAWHDDRKLSLEDRQANREGFTSQISALQEDVRGLREENRAIRSEYDKHRTICQEETDQLRDQVVRLQNRLSGVFRKVADIAVRMARGEVDAGVVAAILELAHEAEDVSAGRD